ncbi:MAG TPA: hypothetical protein VGK80_08955, partial [Rhodanobacteraceae bacterium]
HRAPHSAKHGAIYFGSTSPSMAEAIEKLDAEGMHIDALRVRGYPFTDSVLEFIGKHEHVFVVEQNRDAQLRSLLIEQFEIDPARLVPILHYDGTPITARFIAKAIGERMGKAEVMALRGGKVA